MVTLAIGLLIATVLSAVSSSYEFAGEGTYTYDTWSSQRRMAFYRTGAGVVGGALLLAIMRPASRLLARAFARTWIGEVAAKHNVPRAQIEAAVRLFS